jgi:hypothetical protein
LATRIEPLKPSTATAALMYSSIFVRISGVAGAALCADG